MDEDLKVQHWLFLLFVVSLPLATLLQFRVGGAELQLADLLFVVCVIVWSTAVLFGRAHIRRGWFYLPLAAYAAAAIFSTLASADPHISQVKLFGKLYLIGIAVLSYNLITSILILKRTLQAWLIGAGTALVCSLIGIILFYGGVKDPSVNIVVHLGFASLPPGNYPRIEGFFKHSAVLCNFLAITWAFTLLMVSAGWIRSGTFWAITAGLFAVDMFTLTPGLGGIFLTSGYFVYQGSRSLRPEALRGSAMFTGVLIAAAFLFAASVTLFSYEQNNVDVPLAHGSIRPSLRFETWAMALDTFKQHPLFGRGLGMPVANVVFAGPDGNYLLTDAHNTYLSVLSESGLVGFITFFGIAAFLALTLMRKKPSDELWPLIRLCLLLAMLDAFFYQSLTGSYEDTRHLWVLFGIVAAVCLRPLDPPRQKTLA